METIVIDDVVHEFVIDTEVSTHVSARVIDLQEFVIDDIFIVTQPAIKKYVIDMEPTEIITEVITTKEPIHIIETADEIIELEVEETKTTVRKIDLEF